MTRIRNKREHWDGKKRKRKIGILIKVVGIETQRWERGWSEGYTCKYIVILTTKGGDLI